MIKPSIDVVQLHEILHILFDISDTVGIVSLATKTFSYFFSKFS